MMTYKVVPQKEKITIVTAFLDIGRGEWDNQYKRTTEFYIKSFLHYLEYPYQMVCYVDDRYLDEILEHYVKSPYRNKIFIPINKYWLKNNIHAWKQLDRDREIISSEKYRSLIMKRLQIMFPNGVPSTNMDRIKFIFPENIYSEYNIINHSKIDFIMHAIENGFIPSKICNGTCPITSSMGSISKFEIRDAKRPISNLQGSISSFEDESTITCWCDFGYFWAQHNNDPDTFPRSTLDYGKFMDDKLTFFIQNRAVKECVDPVFMLVQSPEIFTGAFWGGPTKLMKEFQEIYHACVEELYNLSISDDDQHIYLRCYMRNADLFDLKDIEDKGKNKGLLFMCK